MIEPASPAHAGVMSLIHSLAFPPGEGWGSDAFALQLELPGAFGFLSADGGLILARVAADEAEILTVAVTPDARGRGLGRSLLEHAMHAAAGRGAGSLVLEVSVANPAALALYAAAGFGTVGRRPRYYPGGADALIQRRMLTPFAAAAPQSHPPRR